MISPTPTGEAGGEGAGMGGVVRAGTVGAGGGRRGRRCLAGGCSAGVAGAARVPLPPPPSFGRGPGGWCAARGGLLLRLPLVLGREPGGLLRAGGGGRGSAAVGA